MILFKLHFFIVKSNIICFWLVVKKNLHSLNIFIFILKNWMLCHEIRSTPVQASVHEFYFFRYLKNSKFWCPEFWEHFFCCCVCVCNDMSVVYLLHYSASCSPLWSVPHSLSLYGSPGIEWCCLNWNKISWSSLMTTSKPRSSYHSHVFKFSPPTFSSYYL